MPNQLHRSINEQRETDRQTERHRDRGREEGEVTDKETNLKHTQMKAILCFRFYPGQQWFLRTCVSRDWLCSPDGGSSFAAPRALETSGV